MSFEKSFLKKLGLTKPSVPTKKPVADPSNQTAKLSPQEADRLSRGKWFCKYAKEVEVFAKPVTRPELVLNSVAYTLYKEGLTVKGSMRLGTAHSILVILGDLRASRLDIGDAVLVVSGQLYIDESVAHFANEGLLVAGGIEWNKATRKAPPDAIHCPLIFWDDRSNAKTLLVRDGKVIGRSKEEIARLLKQAFWETDMDEVILKPKAIKEALAVGNPIFQTPI